ncbi:MAG: hypothetical protein RR192_02585, partial [Peptostreptococcaceae bacterium]
MINIKNSTAFVRDIKAPSKMILKLRAGVANNKLSNKKDAYVDVSPVEYLKGGSKTTGKTIQDLFRYLSDTCDEVIRNIYFDKSKLEDQEIISDNIIFYSRDEYRSLGIDFPTMITKPIKDIIHDFKALESYETFGVFNIQLLDMDSDIEMLRNISSIGLAYMLFFHMRPYTASVLSTSDSSSLPLTIKAGTVNTNLSLISFINSLTRIFFYHLSQECRDTVTCNVLNNMRFSLKGLEEVESWDKILSKFVHHRLRVADGSERFTVDKISPNLGRYSFSEDESFDKKDISATFVNNDDVFVTSVRNNPRSYDYNIAYCGYSTYLNSSNNSNEAIGVQLYFTHADQLKSNIIAKSLYSSYPFSSFLTSKYDVATLDEMTYDDYDMFNSIDSVMNSKNVVP